MILLTVGTMRPFDRLVRAVDEAVGKQLVSEEVFAQIGHGRYTPRHLHYTDVLGREDLIERVKAASGMIGHAGIGTIVMAINYSKPLLVVPRLKRYGEHVNDHQVDTAEAFAEVGCVLTASGSADLIEKIGELRDFVPKKRDTGEDAIAARIAGFLERLAAS